MACESIRNIFRKMCLIEFEALKCDQMNLAGVEALNKIFRSLDLELMKNRNLLVDFNSEYYSPSLFHSVGQKSANLRQTFADIIESKISNSEQDPVPSTDQSIKEMDLFVKMGESLAYNFDLDVYQATILYNCVKYHIEQRYTVMMGDIQRTKSSYVMQIQFSTLDHFRNTAIHLETKLREIIDSKTFHSISESSESDCYCSNEE